MGRERTRALLRILKGVLAAMGATVAMMAILAGAIVLWNLSDRAITVLNQLVKLIAILLGAVVSVGRGGEKGFITGFVVASVFMLAGYGMYLAFGGADFSMAALMTELILGGGAGALAGAVLANLPGRRRRAG